MLVAPSPKLMSARATSGTPPPRCDGMRICSRTCRSARAFSSSRTRMGLVRSPASKLASAGPTSPMVATRIVDELIADVRDVREVATDRLFQLLLRERSLRFRHVPYRDSCFADVKGATWNSAAIDEDAHHLWPAAHAFGNGIGQRLGIGELRTGRQLNAEH